MGGEVEDDDNKKKKKGLQTVKSYRIPIADCSRTDRLELRQTKSRIKFAYKRARRLHEKGEEALADIDVWVHVGSDTGTSSCGGWLKGASNGTYALIFAPRRPHNTEGWLGLRVGDEVVHSLNPFPIGRHHMLYIGDGLVAGFQMVNLHCKSDRRSKVVVHRIDTELICNLKPRPQHGQAAKRRTKPKLWLHASADHHATSAQRLARVHRVCRSVGIYHYNFWLFNCQHGSSWYVHGDRKRLRSQCVERGLCLLPLVYVVILFVGFALVRWVERIKARKRQLLLATS